MQVNVLAKWGLASSVCLLLAAGAPPTRAQAGGPLPLTPAQTLRPADLTPVEMDQYRTLDPAAAKDFIATRSYVRLCSRVVDGTLPAMQLPARPAGFKADDLLGEDPTVINRALADYLVARDSPDHSARPAWREMTSAQMLRPADLTAEEADYYKTLDPAAAKGFVLTRSYVRLCRRVLDHTLAAQQLPDKPVGFSIAYLLPGDEDAVDQATAAGFSAREK